MPVSLESLGLPASVQTTLARLRQDLLAAGGANLAGLLLYGGLARGRYRQGQSDVNVVVLLRDVSAAALTKVAPVLQRAWREAAVNPLLLTSAEVRSAADAFAIKFLDIQEHHVVLYGEDPFADLQIGREHLRLRVEQELRNLALRWRRRWLAAHDDPAAAATALGNIVRPLALELAVLLRLAGKEVPPEDRSAAIFEAASGAFGLDGPILAALATIRADGNLKHVKDLSALFAGVLQALQHAAEVAHQTRG